MQQQQQQKQKDTEERAIDTVKQKALQAQAQQTHARHVLLLVTLTIAWSLYCTFVRRGLPFTWYTIHSRLPPVSLNSLWPTLFYTSALAVAQRYAIAYGLLVNPVDPGCTRKDFSRNGTFLMVVYMILVGLVYVFYMPASGALVTADELESYGRFWARVHALVLTYLLTIACQIYYFHYLRKSMTPPSVASDKHKPE